MKLSLIALSALLLIGCGTDAEEKKNEAPKPTETTPPVNTQAPPRKLIEGNAQATSPVNLLADPGFSLASREDGGYGAFVAFYDTGSARYTIETTFESRSPSGFGGSVGWVRPDKGTDDKSKAVTLLTSFLGGKGPFHAKIWVAKTNVKGEGVDLPTDGSAVTVSVADGSPESTEAFDLKLDAAATRVVNGRTWLLLRADIPKPLENGGFFVIRTGTSGGHIALTAPEVTSDQLLVGQPVQSSSATASLFRVMARTKTESERSVIAKYKAIPPKLTPAAAAQAKPGSVVE